MICASQFLIDHVRAQASKEAFADKLQVSRPTIYKLLEGSPLSNEVMSKILKETGLELEKAFIVK